MILGISILNAPEVTFKMNSLHRQQEHQALEALWKEMGRLKGDRQAVRENLAAGVPVYYREKDTPRGLQIKEYPDGAKNWFGSLAPEIRLSAHYEHSTSTTVDVRWVERCREIDTCQKVRHRRAHSAD